MSRPKEKNAVSLNLTLDVEEKVILRDLADERRESISRLIGQIARQLRAEGKGDARGVDALTSCALAS